MSLAKIAVAVVAVSLMGSGAWAQSGKMSAKDFAANAASSDMAEIRSSQMALEKASMPQVKEFAQMMIRDHQEASAGLKTAAQQDNVTVPDQMSKKHAAQVDKLNGMSGAGFDKAYMTMQVAAHREALSMMNAYAKDGDSAALKAHAEKVAPTIKMHLEHAQTLQQNSNATDSNAKSGGKAKNGMR